MRRPEDISARIGNIEQIEGVVVAMRALAAAHAQEARKHLTAIREQEATVARAMADALSFLPALPKAAAATTDGKQLRIVVGAAQGFSGSYSERIMSVAVGESGDRASDDFLLIGQRCIAEFESRGMASVWSANMVAHAGEVPSLASRVADAVFELLGRDQITRVSIIYGEPGVVTHGPSTRQLLPLDFARIKVTAPLDPPMTTLPPDILIARLVEEYVFTEVCEALMLGFAAENDARLDAMSRARTNVQHIREDLRTEFAQARQEQTTTEIIELSEDMK